MCIYREENKIAFQKFYFRNFTSKLNFKTCSEDPGTIHPDILSLW